jgi:hypothetical protein
MLLNNAVSRRFKLAQVLHYRRTNERIQGQLAAAPEATSTNKVLTWQS